MCPIFILFCLVSFQVIGTDENESGSAGTSHRESNGKDVENEQLQCANSENIESNIAKPKTIVIGDGVAPENIENEGEAEKENEVIEPVGSVENRPASTGIPVTFGISVTEAVREIRFRIEQRTKLTASAGEQLL